MPKFGRVTNDAVAISFGLVDCTLQTTAELSHGHGMERQDIIQNQPPDTDFTPHFFAGVRRMRAGVRRVRDVET
jgi:hypothetical protein